jgi:filamentous hemagglutinin family protein
MKYKQYKIWLMGGITLFCSLFENTAIAQIRPDNTLPENSVVTQQDDTTVIRQGSRRGGNLFHSFEQFSVPTNSRASFQGISPAVANVFARVTGSNRSVIDGSIEIRQSNGTISPANFFLLNPNGILFGRNASLNIGGSLIATTANQIQFQDGFQFSAVNPQSNSLLSISVPVGLQFGQTPAEIRNRSPSLQVRPNRTIAFVGGEINLPGGALTAAAGQVELAAVGSAAVVNLLPVDQGWTLDLTSVPAFADIHLFDRAVINTSGDRGGNIQIQGRRVTFTQGSLVTTNALTRGQAGDLRIVASDLVELVGISPSQNDGLLTELQNEVFQNATGEAGSLTIETSRLVVRNGAQISTGTHGSGQGVDLTIAASESIDLIGGTADNHLPSGLFSRVRQQNATGNSGDLTIATRRLTLRGGAQLSTDTLGLGDAGELIVNASASVEVLGRDPDNLRAASGLFAQVREGATGQGGNLTIQTEQLTVRGGGQISSNTFGAGQAGNIVIEASDSILISGIAPIARPDNISGVLVSSERGSTGNTGNLTLATRELTIEDGARLSADNFGSGNDGGSLFLTVDRLLLNRGEINATVAAGSGANIVIQASDFVSMQRQSQITAQAFGNANGGNLIISANAVNAMSDQNNDILASADRGNGGNIFLFTRQPIAGFETPGTVPSDRTNDIDASSQFGESGTVTLSLPIETELQPLSLASAEPIQGCQVEGRTATAEFFNTGRGGLPPSPYDPLSASTILDDVRLPTQPIVEATGWKMTDNGKVRLMAEMPDAPQGRCHLRY